MILKTRTAFRFLSLLLAFSLLAAGCSAGAPAADTTVPSPSELAEPTYPTMADYPDEQEYTGRDGTFDDEGFRQVYTAWREDQQQLHDNAPFNCILSL